MQAETIQPIDYPANTENLPDKFPFKIRKNHAKRARQLTQLIELQNEAHVRATDPDTPIKDRAALMRAWCDLQEEKRKLQMRPLPKSVDVSKLPRGKRKPKDASFEEPAGPVPTPEVAQSPAQSEQAKPK